MGERQRLRGYWTLYFDWGWLFGLRLWLKALQVNRGRLTVMGERQRLGLRLLLEALQVDRGWFTVMGERQRLGAATFSVFHMYLLFVL